MNNICLVYSWSVNLQSVVSNNSCMVCQTVGRVVKQSVDNANNIGDIRRTKVGGMGY
jgi:hypothetical protein